MQTDLFPVNNNGQYCKVSGSSISTAHRLREKRGKQRLRESDLCVFVCVLYICKGVSCGEHQTQQAFPCRTLSYCDSLINITPTPSLTHTQIITHQESHLHSKSFKLNSHLFSISRYVPVCILHHISIKQHKGKHLITDAFKETHSINAQTIDTVGPTIIS